jgi:ABC-type nitrate/sulfonate/bicarbonate transport system substrate-binding protein
MRRGLSGEFLGHHAREKVLMKRNSFLPLVLFLWALILPFERAAAQTVVRIGYSGGGTAKNLHKTIEKTGLWKKRGLDVRLIYFTSGATMAQAMVGGDIDIADSDVPAMLNAVTAGVLDEN